MNALVTWVNGDSAGKQWRVAKPHAVAYAKRVAAELVVLDHEPDERHPLLTKLRMRELLENKYDRILFFDSDVLFGPESPDLFEQTPLDSVGIREEIFESWPGAASSLTKGLGDLFAAATIDRNPNQYPHYNTGVMVIPRRWKSVLEDPKFPFPLHHCAEQDWLRYRIHSSGCYVHKFTPGDVGIWATDNRQRFGKLRTVKHFAGAPGRDRQMAVDVLRWGETPASGKCGIVVGHFGIPGAVRMQIALNQRHLKVPMLVTDDWSWQAVRPGESPEVGTRRHEELIDACEWGGCHLRTVHEEQRCKHAGGDLGAFYHGLQWAAENGIEYVMKLSMRAFIHGLDQYLQKFVRLMASRDYHTGTNVCQYGDLRTHYLARSEMVVMHVPTWCNPQILQQLTPRPDVRAAEDIISDIVSRNLTPRMLSPDWFGPDRRKKYPHFWWHDNYEHNPEEGEAEARAIAIQYGVDLGEEFHPSVSSKTPGYIGW